VKLRYTRPALDDLNAILDYVAANSPRAQDAFKDAFKRSSTCLRITPQLAPVQTIPSFVD